MRYAAVEGAATDARRAEQLASAVCFACGSVVRSDTEKWTHAPDAECVLAARCSLAKHREPVVDLVAGLGVIWRYAPSCLGGHVAMYLREAQHALSDEFCNVQWAPGALHLECDGATVHAHVVRRCAPVGETVTPVHDVTHVHPLDEISRSALQRFYTVGLLHLDPLCAPGWRSVVAPPGGGKTTLLLELVRQWPGTRFLLVTFARDIAEELRRRGSDLPNLRVSTLDALCYAAEFETSGSRENTVLPRLEDRQVIEECFPRCTPWYKKRDSLGIGSLLEGLCRSIPLGEKPKAFAARAMCSKHCQFAWIFEHLTTAELSLNSAASTNGGMGNLRGCFAAMRARCARTPAGLERLRASTRGAHVVLVDEAQDLSVQALEILKSIGLPVIAVGDPHQRVYDFEGDRKCPDCAVLLEASTPSKGGFGTGETTMQLYATHRLDPGTCRLLEEWTGLETVSLRPETGDQLCVSLVSMVPPRGPLMLLTRTNRELVQAAAADGSLGVVGGATLSGELERCARYASKTKRHREVSSALERLSAELVTSGQLQAVCADLRARDAPLSGAMTGRIVCTVHRAKGAEAPHVAVFSDVLFPKEVAGTEACIAVVAASRHTKTLSVISLGNRGKRKGIR